MAIERRSSTPNVDDIWATSGTTNLKVSLAEELWTVLEKRIETAIRRGAKSPPVMRAAVRAYELAMASYRRNMSV